MASSYPGALDALTNPTATDTMDSVTVPHATQHANVNDAIEAIQGELGTDPAGASATVKARLDTLDTTVGGKAATAHSHAQADVTALVTDLGLKAPLASPTFTGTPAAPTAADGTNTTQVATTAHVFSGLAAKVALSSVQPELQAATGEYMAHSYPISTSVVPTLDRLMVYPFLVPKACTIDRLSVWCTVAQTSSVVRLGLYSNGTGDRPGALLLDAGTVSTGSGTGAREVTVSQAVPAGLIWFAFAVQTAGGTVAFTRYLNGTARIPSTAASQVVGDNVVGLYKSSITGAFPDPFGTPTALIANSVPAIALRVT